MNNSFIVGLVAWFFPGLGHILQKRLKRGLIIGAAVWAMIIIALLSGGASYPGFDFKDGALLYLLNIFARLGSGLGALVSFIWSANTTVNPAAWATFEYGGRFLEIAGLLNYLAVLDAVDIQLGRKK